MLEQATIDDILLKIHETESDICGVLLFGSVLDKTFNDNSDIDFYVITNKNSSLSRKTLMHNGRTIEFLYNSLDEMKNFLLEEKQSIRRHVTNMVANSKILIDHDNLLSSLKLQAAENLSAKTVLDNEKMLMYKSSIIDYYLKSEYALKTGDKISLEINRNLTINNILELFIGYNGKYLLSGKFLSELFAKLDITFHDKLLDYYNETIDVSKNAILKDLINYTMIHTGGSLPEEWQI